MENSFINLMRGDPAPRFRAATASNPQYIFDTVAGRYVVLCFFVSGSTPGGAAALANSLGMTANSLRQSVHRIRRQLYECVQRTLRSTQ